MSEAAIGSAFDSIADVVERAARLPDHRDRVVETPTVTCSSARGEVRASVHDAKVTLLELSPWWFDDATVEDAAEVIRETINSAFEEWSRQQLDEVMRVTPDMKELAAAIGAAKSQLDDAWAKAVIEAKVP